jgi:DNA replication protein DnaC
MVDRFEKSATLITSQLPIDQWHAYLADTSLADAILDRDCPHACKIELKGESMRKLEATGLDALARLETLQNLNPTRLPASPTPA